MNVVYEAPNSMAPYIAPFNKHIFLPHLHSWKDMVKERLNESVERYTFQFTYLDDFNVNDDLILRVLGKMNISSHERKELFAQHQERHSITASGHDRHLLSTSVSESMLPSSSHSSHTHDQLGLFSPIRITIRIEYFSLLDYMTYNRSWIEINWTIHHVSTFLRMTNYRDLEDLFLENNIDGRSLLQLGLPIDLIQLPKVKEFLSKLNLTEERWRVFRSKIQKLGSVDHLEFLQQISQEECRVRAENERKLELMINAKNEFRQQHQRSQKKTAPVHSTPVKSTTPPAAPATSPNSTPATTVYKFSNLASPESSKRKHEPSTLSSTPMIHGQQEPLQQNQATSETSSPRVARGDTIFSEGIFELVMVGEGAVGKTSIMNRICRDEFHAIEKPTIGTKLMQHALGKLVLDVWDTGGQPAQHATMKARAKRADIILAIYDVSNRDSLITLKTIIAELFQIGSLTDTLLESHVVM